MRTRHLSRRTEKAYIQWIRRYIFFHGKRHPTELGAQEVSALAGQAGTAAVFGTRPFKPHI
jgi:Phage integrase, N-terminal SAM-like domain